MGEVPRNQNSQDIISKNNVKDQDLDSDNKHLNTNYFKVKWLTTTLRFVKDNEWNILVYPEMSQCQVDFIETLITHISSDVELRPLLASIREAMTIFQLKFEFTLKFTKKENGAVQLVFTKHEKGQIKETKNNTNVNSNTKSQNRAIESTKPLIPVGGYKSKKVREKIRIISAVPMQFVLDSLQRIVDFLKDIFSISIIFKDMNIKEWTFLMNVKALLKNRDVLVNQLSAQINELLTEIATHQNHDFTLSLNVDRFDKNKNKRSVTVVKIPKFDQQVTRREKKKNSRNRQHKIPSQELSKESTSSNSNSGDKLLRALSFSGKDEDFKRPLPLDQQSLSSSMESLTVSISSKTDSRHVSIDRRPTSESLQTMNFRSGGILDYKDVKTSNAKKKKPKTKDRGRGIDKGLGPMKSKLIEAMSVPLESTKGLRMMLLMGWKGGALGTRGDGITEPIMPDLQTVSGAGLGHKQKGRPERSKQNHRSGSNSGDSSQNDANNSNKPVILDAVTKTRLEILQGILELVESFNEKRDFYFNRRLENCEINFLEPAIEHFNARTMPDIFQTEVEMKMVEDVTDAMIGNREVLLHVKISSDQRQIEVTKTSDNITFDEPIYNDRFVRCNKDLDENYAEKSIMSDYCEKVTSQLSVDNFMSTMEPMETYNVKTKRMYRCKAFKLMVLGEILDFLEGNELNRIFYIETEIFKGDVTTLKKYIVKVNARRKEAFVSEAEESINERILSKMGNCCLTLDYNENQQLMRISKVFPRNTSNKPTTSTPIRTNIATPVEDVADNSMTEQNEKSQTEMDTDKVLNTQEPRSMLSDDIEEEKIENASESIEKGIKEINDQVLSNVEIDVDNVRQVASDTLDRNLDLADNLLNDQLLSNVETEDVTQKSSDILDRDEDFSDKALILLTDIENLERSILARHKNCQIEPDSSKQISETKNNVIKNNYKLKSYKNIGIMCGAPEVEIDLNVMKEVQKVLSDAIDKCKSDLPLLQYHGVNKKEVVYSCFNEHTYLWIKEVLCDKFIVRDIIINTKNIYQLQMKLNGFYGDIQNVLDKIFLYNPDLDIARWTICREVVTENFTLVDIEVNGDSLEYINQSDFSLFAGFDKVQFHFRD